MKINITIVQPLIINSVTDVVRTNELLQKLKTLINTKNSFQEILKDRLYFSVEKIPFDNSKMHELEKILEEIAELNPQVQIAVSNSQIGKKVWGKILKENSDLNLLHFLSLLGNILPYMIVPSYKNRQINFLPVKDEFYMSIPAKKIKKLKNGAIVIYLVNSLEDFEETELAIKKTAEYYVDFLKNQGLFKKLDINKWRTVNRKLLEEKGFILPEWK